MPITEAQDARLLGDIYEGSQNPAIWERALTQIRDRMNSDMAVLLEVDQHSSRSELVSWTELDPEMLSDYAAYWGQHDPWPEAMLQRSTPGRMDGSQDIMDLTSMRRSAFYNEFWRRYGDLLWSIGGLFDLGQGQIAYFGAPRSRVKGAYTPAQVLWLESIIPHFQRAYRMRSVFNSLADGAVGLLDHLNEHRIGIAMLDANGRILQANDALVNLLHRHKGVAISHNLLLLKEAADRHAYQSLLYWLRHVRAGTSLAAPPTCHIGTERQLGVRAIPLRIETALCRGLPSSCVAILVFSEKARLSLRDELALSFQCTPAEIEVALDLAAGLTAGVISAKRSVTLATVRSQIKSIYIKLGVNRQAELMRKLSAGLALESVD